LYAALWSAGDTGSGSATSLFDTASTAASTAYVVGSLKPTLTMAINWQSPETECGTSCYDGISAISEMTITTDGAASVRDTPPTFVHAWKAATEFDIKPS